jgi:hypothetical protein
MGEESSVIASVVGRREVLQADNNHRRMVMELRDKELQVIEY